MNLKEAIESGKPFKHKKHTWYYREPQKYMLDAISDDWEVVEEKDVPESQIKMEKMEREK